MLFYASHRIVSWILQRIFIIFILWVLSCQNIWMEVRQGKPFFTFLLYVKKLGKNKLINSRMLSEQNIRQMMMKDILVNKEISVSLKLWNMQKNNLVFTWFPIYPLYKFVLLILNIFSSQIHNELSKSIWCHQVPSITNMLSH